MKNPVHWNKDPWWDFQVKEIRELLEKKLWMLKAARLELETLEAKSEWFKKKIEALSKTLKLDDPAI